MKYGAAAGKTAGKIPAVRLQLLQGEAQRLVGDGPQAPLQLVVPQNAVLHSFQAFWFRPMTTVRSFCHK